MTQSLSPLGLEPIVEKFLEEYARGSISLHNFTQRLHELADEAGVAHAVFTTRVREAIRRGDLSDHMIISMPPGLGAVLGLEPMVAMS